MLQGFTRKNWKQRRQINHNLVYKKQLRRNMANYMSNEKVMIYHLIAELIKKILYKMSYFPEPYNCNKNEIKVG